MYSRSEGGAVFRAAKVGRCLSNWLERERTVALMHHHGAVFGGDTGADRDAAVTDRQMGCRRALIARTWQRRQGIWTMPPQLGQRLGKPRGGMKPSGRGAVRLEQSGRFPWAMALTVPRLTLRRRAIFRWERVPASRRS
ncbi:MAG: hypothetical protein A2V70_08520 [Planctomycetes bacterium RBG_13_63_9]|nr:MAG: hypothetical protein A2V70_08520 [Planctomycetes bacterium RBG_13_63_9]